jgi:hypothetical protein
MQRFLKNISSRAVLLVSACLLMSTGLWAQNGSIRGFVYEKKNGEPMPFANVFIPNTSYGTVTDINGFYTITNVEPGDYLLRTTFMGYDTVDLQITIGPGKIVSRKVFLSATEISISVNVTAEKQEKKTEVLISTTKVTPKQIKQIPSVGGEPDLAQYLQVLPGVIFTGDQGGQLYIRGGSPIQNMILLDGMVIYNPFHSIGLFSVFETDIIRNVDVMTGGFNAEYGGRISAVVDIATRDGNKRGLAGKVSSGPFLSKAIIEGPLSKLKESGGGSSSFIVAGKHSYLDRSSKTFYEYVDSSGLPYSFTDLYGKMSFNAQNGSKLNVFGFNFRDRVDFFERSQFDWDATGVGTNFVLVPGNTPTLISGSFSYSDYSMTFVEGLGKPKQSSISGFNLGMDFTYFLTNGEVKYGIEILGFSKFFEFFNTLNIKIDEDQKTTELAGFVKYKNVGRKTVIEPSIRLHYYASLNTLSFEPRIGLKHNLSDNLRWKAAGGVYSQNLISAASDRDVVNLFVGFLSGPEEQIVNTEGEVASFKLQRAIHGITGFEYDLGKHWEINIEGYYKRFSQLINVNRNKLFKSDPNYMIEVGDAYGGDFLLQYDYKKWHVWTAYSLGWVKRNDGVQEYPPHFDRRHNVNLLAGYSFGKDLNWSFDARWNFGTGFPFTKTQGFYEFFSFLDGINTDYTQGNGELEVIYDQQLNGGRLPTYHRLDVSLKRKIALTENSVLEIIASLTNVYDRENIFYFDRIRYERVNQLPFLPGVSASLTF